ncbi:MAG: tyrosine--tRNA ligase [Candidatus Pacebacteria bacterium]|nr:tyrosine--tRNA ligase [Candidatus Paceibacterota bacterium]
MFTHLLNYNVEEIIEKKSLEKKLRSKKKLKIKFGVDPTSPDLHLGHFLIFKKLKEFQELGHQIILIFGDFTAQIGDPSERDSERKPLSKKEVENNLKTYLSQITKFLDINKIRIEKNSKWFSKMKLEEFIKIASNFTWQKISRREDFQKRIRNGIPVFLHEVLYQVLQAYDSVKIKADVEIGGRDQKLNMLAGRDLMKAMGLKPQEVITLPLLPGIDGKEKMSKSKGNYIGILEKPEEKFGKIMSIPDELIVPYFKFLTNISHRTISKLKEDIKKSRVNPRDLKAKLAREIISQIDGDKAAKIAEEEFNKVFKEKKLPNKIPTFIFKKNVFPILDILKETGLCKSNREAKRLLQEGAVKIKIPGEEFKVVKDWNHKITLKNNTIIQVGKRKFIKINCI